MRTRSQSRNNFPQQEASPAIVEPLRIELPFLEDQFQEDPPKDPPEVPMADNQTMAELSKHPPRDSLNSAAGGNFLDKMPRECLKIIESKSKDLVRALLLDKRNQSSALASSSTRALVKAVEPNCFTCGGGQPLEGCLLVLPKQQLTKGMFVWSCRVGSLLGGMLFGAARVGSLLGGHLFGAAKVGSHRMGAFVWCCQGRQQLRRVLVWTWVSSRTYNKDLGNQSDSPNIVVQKDLSKPVTAQSLPENEKDQLLKQIASFESKLASQDIRSYQKEYHELRTSYNALKVNFDSLNWKRMATNVSKKVHMGESSKPFSKRVSQFTTYSLQKDRKFSKNSQKGFKTRDSNAKNHSFETSHSYFTPVKQMWRSIKESQTFESSTS
uniref:Reverse transcriptase domain-containing protein n=1 Tax=Tanacetum cinerariifolium TaxID=118510 RepID=A0A6L2MIJ3_TANCI|nr:hypothetical protein [Tanacetum cinerariifolium]